MRCHSVDHSEWVQTSVPSRRRPRMRAVPCRVRRWRRRIRSLNFASRFLCSWLGSTPKAARWEWTPPLRSGRVWSIGTASMTARSLGPRCDAHSQSIPHAERFALNVGSICSSAARVKRGHMISTKREYRKMKRGSERSGERSHRRWRLPAGKSTSDVFRRGEKLVYSIQVGGDVVVGHPDTLVAEQ